MGRETQVQHRALLVHTWSGHLPFMRMALRKEEGISWAWVRELLERLRSAGGGLDLGQGSTWTDAAITRSHNPGPGQILNLLELLSHLQNEGE